MDLSVLRDKARNFGLFFPRAENRVLKLRSSKTRMRIVNCTIHVADEIKEGVKGQVRFR